MQLPDGDASPGGGVVQRLTRRVREFLPPAKEVKEEARAFWGMSWPMAITNVLNLAMGLINVAFVGRISETAMAAAALTTMVANVCWAGAIGMLTSIDTLASQAYGAQNIHKVGVIMQRGMLCVSVYAVPVIVLWCFSEPVLRLLGQTAEVSRLACLFTRFLAIAAVPQFLSEAVKRTLMTTGVVIPQLIVGVISCALTGLLDWILIIVLHMGYFGAVLSLTFVWFLQLPLILVVIRISGYQKRIWRGFSREAFHKLRGFLSLALPGMLMVAAEWTAIEIMAIIAGKLGEVQLAAYSALYSTVALCYMVPLTVAITCSARIGFRLGENNPRLAKVVAIVAYISIFGISLIYLAGFFVLRRPWSTVLTSQRAVQDVMVQYMWCAVVLEFWDGLQGLGSGILRGCGLQLFGGVSNFIFYYLVGVPLAFLMVFLVYKSLMTLYLSFSVGVAAQAFVFLFRLLSLNWEQTALKVEMREHPERFCKDKEPECKDAVELDDFAIVTMDRDRTD